MEIVIDARMYGLEHAGIGRYVANLVGEIKNLKLKIGNSQFILLVRRKNLEEIRTEFGDFFRLVVCEIPHYSLAEQIFLPFYLAKLKPDLVHFPHFNVPIFWSGKYVVTIHDLIKHYSLGSATTTRAPFLYWLKHPAYRLIVYLAVKRAAAVITPSHWWKEELIKHYHLAKNKIFVTYEGVDKKFDTRRRFEVPPPRRWNLVRKRYKITKPFIIYTGSLYPHKNVSRLVAAVKQLNDMYRLSLRLVVVCARNVFYERFAKEIDRQEAANFVKLIGFIPDEELVSLYTQAEAFVFPSLLEGFGLPGLEAMACGLPVISSNATCLPEIYGGAALYFDPTSVEDLERKIIMVIKDRHLRAELKVRGRQQAKKYSWWRMAKQTIKLYESCFSLRSGQ